MKLSCRIRKKIEICASPSAFGYCLKGVKRKNRKKCRNCRYYIPKIAYENFMQRLNSAKEV